MCSDESLNANDTWPVSKKYWWINTGFVGVFSSSFINLTNVVKHETSFSGKILQHLTKKFSLIFRSSSRFENYVHQFPVSRFRHMLDTLSFSCKNWVVGIVFFMTRGFSKLWLLQGMSFQDENLAIQLCNTAKTGLWCFLCRLLQLCIILTQYVEIRSDVF